MYGSMETEKFIVASQCMYRDATDMIYFYIIIICSAQKTATPYTFLERLLDNK